LWRGAKVDVKKKVMKKQRRNKEKSLGMSDSLSPKAEF
jgi:hypothetical protein